MEQKDKELTAGDNDKQKEEKQKEEKEQAQDEGKEEI